MAEFKLQKARLMRWLGFVPAPDLDFSHMRTGERCLVHVLDRPKTMERAA